jgi:hypothetical protein
MPASKKRKGHNKRLQKRKNEAKLVQQTYQKMFNEVMKAQIEELKRQQSSGDTTNNSESTDESSTEVSE